MYIHPLDKQIEIAGKIIKLFQDEKVTFSEYPFINVLVNDIVETQKENLKYPDIYHYINKIKAVKTDDITIKFEGEE